MLLSLQPIDPDRVIIVVGPAVAPRLETLGLTEEALRSSVWTGLLHYFRCTRHDPPSLPGYLAWGKTVRDLRDRLVPSGWGTPNDDDNYSTIVRSDGLMAVAVAGGDSRTGYGGDTGRDYETWNPSTRRAKGPVTERAIGVNQLTLADILPEFPVPRSVAGLQTWLLLYYVDEEADEVRMELSLPRGMADSGHVDVWKERIILEPMSLTGLQLGRPDSGGDKDDDDNDLDIPVGRR